jgi:molybdopterin converting factor small subunit
MEVVTLNSTNYIGLSANYSPDSLLKFNQNIYYTEEGVDLPLSQALAKVNDSAVNNYSSLFLTQSIPLVSSVYIENLNHIPDDGFTTYLAASYLASSVPTLPCLTVQEPPFNISTAAISMSGSLYTINNACFFTIKFHTDNLCKIEHVNGSTIRYLTMASDQSLVFTFDTNTDYLDDLSPQLFNYLYDRVGNYIILSKNLEDIPHYLCYYNPTSALSAIPAVSGIPSYLPSAIFSCIPRPVEPNDTLLFDPWVGYTQDFLTNTQNIDPNRTTVNITSNTLLHSQYLSLTGQSLDVNALSLKTTNTPENYQSRNNPFQTNKSQYLSEDDNNMREYKSLYTGSNQVLGDDNVTLGYDSFTTDIVLKADKVTYFHVPQSLYPFIQININDSGLVQAGAIAGDHPIKADKIFKKQASAKNTSPFGSASGELNGTFLCSWLSGGSDLSIKPTWVDRYYNPSKVSFITALTSRSLKAISYSTVFEGYAAQAGNGLSTDEVFDVPSNLIFEPDTYYAYYHYGLTGVSDYINTFIPYLVERDFPGYLNIDGSSAITDQILGSEYLFNGNTYAVTNSLSGIQDSNQFTLCFDMYNQDWSMPFGNQIIGNFVNDGFGIFNENLITPTVFVNSASSLSILNTDLQQINTVNYPATALAFLRPSFGKNYSVVCNDGYLYQYTSDDRLIRKTFSPYLSSTIDSTNTETAAYILCPTTTSTILLSANLITNSVTRITPANSYIANSNTTGFPAVSTTTGTINYYNSAFYFTPGSLSRRVNNTIYYITDNNTSIIKWNKIDTNTTTVTAFKASSSAKFADFNIDFDGNIWIINNNNNFYKYTQNSEFLLSGSLTSNTPTTTTINLTGNGSTRSYLTSATGTLPLSSLRIVVNNTTLRPTFDYSLSGNSVVFVNPPLSGYFGSITYTQNLDTFVNSKISFISEFIGNTYYDHVLFARTGSTYKTLSNSVTSLSTSPAYQFLIHDTLGNQLSSTYYFTTTGNAILANTDYLREWVQDVYPEANLNIKATTTNIYDSTDVSLNEIVFNLSALDPGYHHFAVRFDSFHGYMSLFVDSRPVQTIQFTPRKYKFSNLIYRPFLIGSSCINNSLPLFKYLKKNVYLTENIGIKNFYLYDTPLNDYDIVMHARQNGTIQDIHFDIPCGRRNYLEEIERYFKATLPGSKSTQYNVVIRNTGITDPAIQSAIEARMTKTIINSAPAYSKLNTIKWVN